MMNIRVAVWDFEFDQKEQNDLKELEVRGGIKIESVVAMSRKFERKSRTNEKIGSNSEIQKLLE